MTPRRLPPLNALKAFEAAARHLSFTLAAEELFVTHGAVSRQVKALEEALSVRLFERHNRRITLTGAGGRLLPSVTSALDLLETSVAQIAPRRGSGHITVSCFGTFMMRWLIPRLRRFQSAYPNIDVRLSASDNTVDIGRNGIDVAIRTGTAPWPDGLTARTLFPEWIGPVCSPAYARRIKLKEPTDIKCATLLHTETRLSAWQSWCDAVGLNNCDVASGPRFEHFYFMLQGAAAGLGLAIGGEAVVKDDMENQHLVAPFGFIETGNSYVVLTSTIAQHDPDIAAFCDWVIGEGQV